MNASRKCLHVDPHKLIRLWVVDDAWFEQKFNGSRGILSNWGVADLDNEGNKEIEMAEFLKNEHLPKANVVKELKTALGDDAVIRILLDVCRQLDIGCALCNFAYLEQRFPFLNSPFNGILVDIKNSEVGGEAGNKYGLELVTSQILEKGPPKATITFLTSRAAEVKSFVETRLKDSPLTWDLLRLQLINKNQGGQQAKSDLLTFARHITEKAKQYVPSFYEDVMVFEFFLPLNHESRLKSVLDSLFYEDLVKEQLRRIPIRRLANALQISQWNGKGTPERIVSKALQMIKDHFGGYSIGQVDGRYRPDRLMTISGAADSFERTRQGYLFDETTGMVRFIFKCGEPTTRSMTKLDDIFDPPSHHRKSKGKNPKGPDPMRVANAIRFLFWRLFVRNIVEAVSGEDQIWLLESGIWNRLYVWKKDAAAHSKAT